MVCSKVPKNVPFLYTETFVQDKLTGAIEDTIGLREWEQVDSVGGKLRNCKSYRTIVAELQMKSLQVYDMCFSWSWGFRRSFVNLVS